MDCETLYFYILVRPLEFQPALTQQLTLDFTSCYQFFAILYTLRMSKFYMPTLINHRINSETAPISFILFQFQAGEAYLSAFFSMVNTYAI